MNAESVSRSLSHDVFISYSSVDKNVTDALCHFLEERKIRCWIAPRDILPGQEYADAIVHAISNVKIFVLVCSKDSLQSQWVRKETNLAVSDNKIIIPFKIADCSLEGTAMKLYLGDRHWIDAIPYPNKAFDNLLIAISSLLGKQNNMFTMSEEKVSAEKQDTQTNQNSNQHISSTEFSSGGPYRYNDSPDKFFTKENIVAMVKLHPWLLMGVVFSVFFTFLYLRKITDVLYWIHVCSCLILVTTLARFNKEHIVLLMILPVLMFCPYLNIIFLLFEFHRFRKIIRTAGLPLSLIGVSKAAIADFKKLQS